MKVSNGLNGNRIAQNRKKFIQNIYYDREIKLVMAYIEHGIGIQFVRSVSSPVRRYVDGIMTNKVELYLGTTFADCPTVFFYDPVKNLIGIAHCSWKNTAKNFPSMFVKTLVKKGSNKKDICAAIEPAIQLCCYDFGKDDANKYFGNYSHFIHSFSTKGKCKLDLPGIIEHQLISEGINPSHIEKSTDCTCCNKDIYFSYRGEKMKPENIMAGLAVIGINRINDRLP